MSLRKVALVVNSLKGHSASVSGNSADICSAESSSLVKFEIKAFLARAPFTPQLEVAQSVFFSHNVTHRLGFIISVNSKKRCAVSFFAVLIRTTWNQMIFVCLNQTQIPKN